MLQRNCAPRPNLVCAVAKAGFNNGNSNMNKRASTRVWLCRSANKMASEDGTMYDFGFDKSDWPSDRLVNLFCGLVQGQKSTFEAADLVPVLELANKWERDRIAALVGGRKPVLEEPNCAVGEQLP